MQQIQVAVDSASVFSPYTGPFSLPAGGHQIAYRAVDNAGNISAAQTQTANIDDQAPVSTVTINGPQFTNAIGTQYVSSLTSFTVTAVDSSTSLIVSGVASIQTGQDLAVSVSTESSVFVSPFQSAEKFHTLSFFAQDTSGNIEPSHDLSVFLDLTPPVVFTQTSPALFFDGQTYFGSTSTLIGFSAVDPVSGGDDSGVSSVQVSVDGAAFTVVLGSITFSQAGVHTLRYFAQDEVGNVSAVQTLTFTVTANAPTAVLTVSPPAYVFGGVAYASAQTQFSLSVATGTPAPDYFQINLDSGGFVALASSQTLSISTSGAHLLEFRAVRGESRKSRTSMR